MVDHTFEEAGEYTTLLTVIDANGRSAKIEGRLTVGGQDSSSEADNEGATTNAETESPAGESTSADTAGGELGDGAETKTEKDDSSSRRAPGFGISVGLAGVGGAAYLLNRVGNEPEE